MKTIVFPFDNSPVADNALLYAKQLSRNTQSRLVLFKKQNLQNLFRNPHFIFSAAQALEKKYYHRVDTKTTNRQELAENREPVMQMQGACAIAAVACKEQADLIVAGTEKEFEFNDLYINTIANLIKQAKCPLLLIPNGVKYKPINKIVVVIEHEANISHRVDLLLTLANLYQAHISFLQITKEEHPHVSTYFLESWREMYLAFPYEKTDFYEITQNCIPKGVKQFVKQLKADLLVVIPNLEPVEPYSNIFSHYYNEVTHETVSVPVLALDSLSTPSDDLFINYYN